MARSEPAEWELAAEILSLEREARRLSAVRRKLHDRIDAGYGNEATEEREREVSYQRIELHRRIDALRELLVADAQLRQ